MSYSEACEMTMEEQVFRWLGMLLMGFLVVWIALDLATVGERMNPWTLITRGPQFETMSGLTEAEVKGALDIANERASSANQRGIWLAWAATIALWLSFAASSLVTFLSGLKELKIKKGGSSVGADSESPAPDAAAKATHQRTRQIAIAGAIAAIATGFSGLTDRQAKATTSCVESVSTQMEEVLDDIESESNVLRARQYLEDLDRISQRC